MVSELVLLRPASVPTDEGFYVEVGKARKNESLIFDLKAFISRRFNFPHPQVSVDEDGGVTISGLYEGIPEGADYSHEVFDHILDLVGWIEGRVELPISSESVAPEVFDEMPQLTETSEVVRIGESLKDGEQTVEIQILEEIPSCDLLNGDDGSTEKKVELDSSLKNDEELIQIEAKAEPIVTKELSSLAVRQVFDEMPRRIASYRTSSDVPVLFRVGSFVPMVSEPNLPPSKYDHGKVNPRLHKLILETYINSVACLELHYFDPGGKGFKLGGSLISNENELVHELVNDEYEHKDICVGSVNDHKTDFCWHFGANSKHGQAKVALDNVTRVMFDPGGVAYIPSTDLHQARAAILGFEVNQPDLLASEISHAKVSFTLQKLSLVGDNDMFKLPHMLTAQGEMTNGFVRVLCFDPGGEEIELAIGNSLSILLVSLGEKHDNLTVFEDENDHVRMMCFDPGGAWHTSSGFVLLADASHKLKNDEFMLKYEDDSLSGTFLDLNHVKGNSSLWYIEKHWGNILVFDPGISFNEKWVTETKIASMLCVALGSWRFPHSVEVQHADFAKLFCAMCV